MLKIEEFLNKGRGIVTTEAIIKDQLIEKSPVIVLPKDEIEFIDKTCISDYCFCWGAELDYLALATGYGSLYNHSSNANTRFERDNEGKMLYFYAVRDIQSGEEITINYCQGMDDMSLLWFKEFE